LKRFDELAVEDLARLERFRRVATEHNLKIPNSGMVDNEIGYIRDQLNALVYLQAKLWMLPSWAVLTLKSLDKEDSLPTEFPNNSYRNWSLVGGVGARNHGIVDSRGLTSTQADIGSIDVWVQEDEGDIIFPALMGKDGPQLHLVSSEDQLYEWRTEIKSVEFVRLVYHVKQGDEEYLYNEITLRNIALEKTEATFYVAVRPMSPWGVDPIEEIEYDKLENRIIVNGTPALQFVIPPSAVILSEADNEDIPELIRTKSTRMDTELKSKNGLGTAILRFDVKLTPAGSKRFFLVSPLESTKKDKKQSKLNPKPSDRDQSIGNWYMFSEQLVKVIFPDPELDKVFSQAAVSLAIQVRSVMFPEESYLESYSWNDRMRVFAALINSGSMDIAEKLTLEIVQEYAIPDGLLDRSIFSPLLWGLLQLYSHSPNSESITRTREYINLLTDRLVETLASPKVEETDSEVSDDSTDDAQLQHYVIIDETHLNVFNQLLWDLAALKEALRFHVATKKPIVSQLSDAITQIKRLIQNQLNEIRSARWPRPQDPVVQELDRAILDILTSVAQLRITQFDMKFLRGLCTKVEGRRIVRNLWKTSEPGELFSSHLSLRMAHFYVFDRQRTKIEPFLQRSLEFLSEDYLLPDFVDIRTYGGSGGTGSSVLAAADIILLLNDMIVHEAVSNLIFLPGIPETWYTSKRSLIVNGIPTKFGRAHIELGMSANQHQIETRIEDLPEEIEIHVPDSVPLRMVKSYGGSIVDRAIKARSPHLRLIPLSNEVTLTYHK